MRGPRLSEAKRLELRQVTKHYTLRGRSNDGRVVHAVDDVSLSVAAGETVAIVGESGCGKSTLAKCVVGAIPVTSGAIVLDGDQLDSESQWRQHRRQIQFVSQNPHSALNRRRTIGDSIAQALRTHDLASGRAAVSARVTELLELVGLPSAYSERHSSGVSGGELQRVAIARALAVNPSVLVLDEPTSSLDVSVKALIINLLQDLQRELGLSYLIITHEIDIARYMAGSVAVMYLGHLVETATVDKEVALRHPYSQLLFGSQACADPDKNTGAVRITGEVPSAITPPSGCRFHTRCPIAIDRCRSEPPTLEAAAAGHPVVCHRVAEGIDVTGSTEPLQPVAGPTSS